MKKMQASEFQRQSVELRDTIQSASDSLQTNQSDLTAIRLTYVNWHEIKTLASLFEIEEISELAFQFEKIFGTILLTREQVPLELLAVQKAGIEWFKSIIESKIYEQPLTSDSFQIYLTKLNSFLPIVKKSSPSTSAVPDQLPPAAKPMPKKPPTKVLVIDDEPVNRILLHETILAIRKDIEVISVDNASEALFYYFTDSFNLVFLDIMMPVIDGNDFLAIVEKNRLAGNIKVSANIVVQTAIQSLAQLTSYTKKECVQEVIRKPINAERIKECIERYC